MLFVLYTSKTHDLSSKPQKIKISSVQHMNTIEGKKYKCFFCPFAISREYLAIRGNYIADNDLFFVLKQQLSGYTNTDP